MSVTTDQNFFFFSDCDVSYTFKYFRNMTSGITGTSQNNVGSRTTKGISGKIYSR